MNYYVIETQTRQDGVINTSMTGRNTFAGGLSLYHERYSKMCMNDQFVSVSLMLVDQNLKVIERDVVQTLYVAPAEETTESDF